MSNKRPIYLSLTQFKFPLTAIVSIKHRITGIFLFLFSFFVFYLWDLSLSSEVNYQKAIDCLMQPSVRLFFFVILLALWFHLIAGIRHILLDFHIGVSKLGGKISSVIVLVVFFLGSIGLGFFLW